MTECPLLTDGVLHLALALGSCSSPSVSALSSQDQLDTDTAPAPTARGSALRPAIVPSMPNAGRHQQWGFKALASLSFVSSCPTIPLQSWQRGCSDYGCIRPCSSTESYVAARPNTLPAPAPDTLNSRTRLCSPPAPCASSSFVIASQIKTALDCVFTLPPLNHLASMKNSSEESDSTNTKPMQPRVTSQVMRHWESHLNAAANGINNRGKTLNKLHQLQRIPTKVAALLSVLGDDIPDDVEPAKRR